MAQETATQFFQPGAGIDVKRAAILAAQAVRDLFGADGIKNVMLEEVEYLENANEWRVTVGFDRPRTGLDTSPFAAGKMHAMLEWTPVERAYKEVYVDGASGTIKSVKMRRQ